jgi:hypothetical protein
MLNLISSDLRRISLILKWATKVDDIPEMFQIMAEFLKKEPDKNFSYYDELPLNMNDEAFSTFEKMMAKFPEVVSAGKAQTKREQTPVNFLITLGQMLVRVAWTFAPYIDAYVPKLIEKYKNIVPLIENLHKIWGSFNEMNATALAGKYQNKSIPDTKRSLIQRMESSASLIRKKILPAIKAVEQES